MKPTICHCCGKSFQVQAEGEDQNPNLCPACEELPEALDRSQNGAGSKRKSTVDDRDSDKGPS